MRAAFSVDVILGGCRLLPLHASARMVHSGHSAQRHELTMPRMWCVPRASFLLVCCLGKSTWAKHGIQDDSVERSQSFQSQLWRERETHGAHPHAIFLPLNPILQLLSRPQIPIRVLPLFHHAEVHRAGISSWTCAREPHTHTPNRIACCNTPQHRASNGYRREINIGTPVPHTECSEHGLPRRCAFRETPPPRRMARRCNLVL